MLEYRTVRNVQLAFDWVDAGPELLVFIHGVGADKSAWAPQVTFFSQLGYSVAAVDMRGTGDSQARTEEGLALPITMHDFASDVDGLIRELGFEQAHWIGNSMGGVIIMEAMKRGFTTIRKAVLCNTFAKHPASRDILPRPGEALKSRSLAQFSAERIPFAFKTDIEADVLQEAIHAMARKDVETYLLSWRETWSHDYRDFLPGVDTPSLVVTGSIDRITPPALGEEIAQLIPNARYHQIAGAAHISNLDAPEEFNEVVYDFLKS